MNKLLSILSLLIFVSCGGTYDFIETNEILGTGDKDSKLAPYLNDFERDIRASIPSSLSINVVNQLINYCKGQPGCDSDDDLLPNNVDAVCWSNNGIGQKVEIRRSRWNDLSEESREQLIYHELGHCVLNKEHHNGYEDGSTGYWCPSSIMNPFTFTEWQIEECYTPDRFDYIKELRK